MPGVQIEASPAIKPLIQSSQFPECRIPGPGRSNLFDFTAQGCLFHLQALIRHQPIELLRIISEVLMSRQNCGVVPNNALADEALAATAGCSGLEGTGSAEFLGCFVGDRIAG